MTFPTEVFHHIISFVSDARTLCNLGCTDRGTRSLIENDTSIWSGALKRRWRIHTFSSQRCKLSMSPESEFRRRLDIDREVTHILEQLSHGNSSYTTSPSDIHYHDIERFLQHGTIPGKEESLTNEYDVFWLRAMMARHGNDGLEAAWKFLSCEELASSHLSWVPLQLRSVTICEEMTRIIQDYSDAEGRYSIVQNQMWIEDMAILFSNLYDELPDPTTDWQSDNDTPLEKNSIWIREQLENMANSAKERFPSSESSRRRKEHVGILNDVFSERMSPVDSSRNFYEVENSLLSHVLRQNKGIPMTLAIIYQAVARRLGIHAYIVGLPGHIVVGISNLFEDDEHIIQYVDVFHYCQWLSEDECSQIVQHYGYSMHERFVLPLPVITVAQRMLNNVLHCISRRVEVSWRVQVSITLASLLRAAAASEDPFVRAFKVLCTTWNQQVQ